MRRYVNVLSKQGRGKRETRWKLKLVCASPACRVDDFVGTALDLVDIDPIESYARPLRSFESFLNASAKLTYIRSITINDKGEKKRHEIRSSVRVLMRVSDDGRGNLIRYSRKSRAEDYARQLSGEKRIVISRCA